MFTENLESTQQYDFSTASEWEMFIARLEEIILEWKLHLEKIGPPLKPNELATGDWEIKTESATFADTEFVVSFHKLKQDESNAIIDSSGKFEVHEDLLSLENDFLSMMLCEDGSIKPHYISRWYGLKKFVVLTPVKGSSILNESKIKILMSSMTIAVNNQNCEVPMFAQVLEPWQNYFVGICEGRGFRSEFDMIHLKKIPPHCKYLSGLLNVFKSKIACSCTLDPIQVSARFSYLLKDFTQFEYQIELPDFQQTDTSSTSLLEKLPFGTACEPLSEMTMYATWPKLVESIVVDTESYSDLDPQQAPLWYLAAKMTESQSSLLYDYLTEFLMLSSSPVNVDELLGDLVQAQQHDARIGARSRLVDTPGMSPKPFHGPLPEDQLMFILNYLFPVASGGNSRNEYPESIGCQIIKQDDVTQEGLGGFKSCPPDGLVWRLAISSAQALYTMGGAKSFAHVWFEFVQELRYRWENSIRIPGVPATFPDLKTCLLNQKLQLLNCCIDKKIAREKAAMGESTHESDEGDEEFFDCDEEDKIGGGPVYSLWNQPTGRLRKHSEYKLVETGIPLYVPITQDPIPKTEDQIEEDAEFLLSLGDDAQSSELRAMLMSASLRSDMESFKAANPGSALEDFIRWYSPRDLIESSELDQYGQKKGTLSARMQLPGNTWREVWDTAKPVPARRQRRLFDDTKEAEKILHLFECHQPGHVAQLLVPALMHAGTSRLLEAIHPVPVSSLNKLASHLIKRVEFATRCPDTELKRYQDISSEIGHIEALVSQYHSLHLKLSPDSNDSSTQQFLADLVMNPSAIITVPEGPHGVIGKRISQMFYEAQKVASMRLDAVVSESSTFSSQDPTEPWSLPPSPFSPLPSPSCREFILRVVAPRPAPSSRPTPQKLTALILSPDSLLMSGCFTQDTTFQ
uniref:Rab3 GTPase-activating protein catalytic subunit n=1 Tax=Cacopsylla melanoneura TaxID=428564 RepID=A0A8D8V0Z5_9HEMI